MDPVGALVNSTIEESRPDPDAEPTMNYTEAARVLAERQLASCYRTVNAADVEADNGPGGLSDDAADRLLGGLAVGYNITDEEWDVINKALSAETTASEAPQILGIQVHSVPLFLQILYILGVGAAVCFVVRLVVQQLTKREREKEEEKNTKKEAKGKKVK
eukprot:gnl/TRDRNA2_/TRDRNA2_42805_c0_seq1.p1 gnl/TRDRNA2_/TRDRNA2_42805_c0~~gnl/TRDRNA2_/TRDRNA2_42805_c0_seq1.p1  ORF type:complete len:161 (+),score=46.45 gnl/TRDRNA2_/TRDRNA2_42805_c0_seq1:2-484(+)